MNVFQYISMNSTWENPVFLIALLVWLIIWKGNALLIAADKKDKLWFWILMVVNSFGILEILYIFLFSKTREELKQLSQKYSLRKLFSKKNRIKITLQGSIEEVAKEVNENNDEVEK